MTKKKENKYEQAKDDPNWNLDGNKEIEDKLPKVLPYVLTKEEKEQEKAEIAKAKKLDALWDELATKFTELNVFLTVQGLGQFARQKVVNLVKEIKVVQDKIAKEEE